MPSGKTIEMLEIDRTERYRRTEPRPQKDRDRTLNGKARIRARRLNKKEQ